MKTRARRLAEYLESECGYTIYRNEKTCPKCGHRTYDCSDKFCGRCGTRVRSNKLWREDAEQELEDALLHIESQQAL